MFACPENGWHRAQKYGLQSDIRVLRSQKPLVTHALFVQVFVVVANIQFLYDWRTEQTCPEANGLLMMNLVLDC